MKIGIFSNLTRDIGGKAALKLYNFIKNNSNHEIFLSDELKNIPFGDNNFYDKQTLARMVDVMAVFGGDGTILRIAKECAKNNTVIFAVNCGGLGYLAETEKEDMTESYQEFLSGNYSLESRAFLHVFCDNKEFFALNEAVIERGTQTKMLKSEIKVNGASVGRYNSDGIIFSTPTGSTAYSLSAGGPILAPDVKAVIIAPICPHSLHSRPIVVPDTKIITLEILEHNNTAHLNVDGDEIVYIPADTIVTVKNAEIEAKFIRLRSYNYYEKLKERMKHYS